MRQQFLYWWLPLVALSLITYRIQTNMFFYMDNAFILHTVKQILEGQTYTQHIFEPNPPMIFYLQIPVVILAKLTSINILSIFRLYVIALIILSMMICYHLMIQLFNKNKSILYTLSYILFISLLYLPTNHFGQREHFMVILTLPYWFAAALNLENKKIHIGLAILIGVMAGLGFAIKPHFLSALVLVELYFIIKKNKLLGWVRVESLIVIAILIAYVCMIILFHSEFIQIVLPLWWQHYAAVKQPWLYVLSDITFLFCIATYLYCFSYLKKNRYRTISIILLIASIGFNISYLVPQVAWYYHIYPAVVTASLLLFITASQTENQVKRIKRLIIASIIFLIPMLVSALFQISAITSFKDPKNTLHQLIEFLNVNSPHNTFDVFTMSHTFSPIEFYSSAKYVGSFELFSWNYDLATQQSKQTIALHESYAADIITTDLEKRKPRFVLIDMITAKAQLGFDLNYVETLSKYPNFKKAWKNYHYLKTIDHYQIYEQTTF